MKNEQSTSLGKFRVTLKTLFAIIFFTIPIVSYTVFNVSPIHVSKDHEGLVFFGAFVPTHDIWFFAILFGFIVSFILFVSFIFGKLWCGFACPQTVVIESAPSVHKFFTKITKTAIPYKSFSTIYYIIVSLINTIFILLYFQDPIKLLNNTIYNLDSVTLFWGVLTFVSFFAINVVERNFCRSICPYMRFMTVIQDSKSLSVQYIRERNNDCVHCERCVTKCPYGLDLRVMTVNNNGIHTEPMCTNCSICISECSKTLGRLGKKSLFSYSFNLFDNSSKAILRPVSFVLGAIMITFASFTLSYLLHDEEKSAYEFKLEVSRQKLYNVENTTKSVAYKLKIENNIHNTTHIGFFIKDLDNTSLDSIYTVTPGDYNIKDKHEDKISISISREVGTGEVETDKEVSKDASKDDERPRKRKGILEIIVLDDNNANGTQTTLYSREILLP